MKIPEEMQLILKDIAIRIDRVFGKVGTNSKAREIILSISYQFAHLKSTKENAKHIGGAYIFV